MLLFVAVIFGVFSRGLSLPRALSDVGLDTIGIIENHGYPSETHDVTTEDGYILTLHRIPRGINDSSTPRPAVFLMHGMTSSSSDFVNMGPGRSLSYSLADAGYDVWLGNARGNGYSRRHTTLDIVEDAEEFFDFSFHEIGYYDVAASIDYILSLNGDDSVYYVGHSQGTTAFFVLASTRPEYNQKIKVASLLAPAAILEHRPFNLIWEFCKYVDKVEDLLKKYKIYEVPFLDQLHNWVKTDCVDPNNYAVCHLLFSIFGNIDEDQLEDEMIPVIGTNAPSNTAMKQFIHFGQQVRNGGFSQFDYGAAKNLELYGTETPPSYDFSKISAPVAAYYAVNDGTVPIEDSLNVISKIPNLAEKYEVPFENFNHLDFIFAKDTMELVYDRLLAVMQQY